VRECRYQPSRSGVLIHQSSFKTSDFVVKCRGLAASEPFGARLASRQSAYLKGFSTISPP
jgi:hypothetical protein